jgi:hypothetical protein
MQKAGMLFERKIMQRHDKREGEEVLRVYGLSREDWMRERSE